MEAWLAANLNERPTAFKVAESNDCIREIRQSPRATIVDFLVGDDPAAAVVVDNDGK